MQHVDRNGTPLEEGQFVRLQQAVGKNGETRVVSGEIEKLYDTPPGVTLRLDEDLMDRRFNGHTQVAQLVKAGESLYATLPHKGIETTERLYDGVKFESWVEVTKAAPEISESPKSSRSRMRP